MPVTLDEMMREFSPEERAEIERAASDMVADYRLRKGLDGSDTDERSPHNETIAVGTKARTGQRCPSSGIWQVESTTSVTAPITVHNVMPPYADRAVTWVLVQHA